MNMFQIAIVVFNNWTKIQRVITLAQPIIVEYNKTSSELTQLINELAEAFFPTHSAPSAPTIENKGYSVKQLQVNLKRLGYTALEADGIYGPDTTEAVRSFQAHQGLTADGWYGVETAAKMAQALENAG